MKEVGTLKELDVKPGDVVVCVWAVTSRVFTVGKTYRMTDKGLECDTSSLKISTASTFRVISRANTPKLWRDMTDAEKCALLLAHHEGKVIEFKNDTDTPDWKVSIPRFASWCYYRVRPEPKVEVVTMYAASNMKGFGPTRGVKSAYQITFNTIDGKPDTASIKMEAI